MKVLVVDDDKDLAWAMGNGLTESGYAVDMAENGLDGQDGES